MRFSLAGESSDRSRLRAQIPTNNKTEVNNTTFSRPAFSSKDDGDKRTMAATAGEGTAPKLGSGKCAGSTSASNSRVRCDVTGGRDPTTNKTQI